MYEIYTDGSCVGNPVAGGWGVMGKGITTMRRRSRDAGSQDELHKMENA
jgi:ribonuclease HI